MNTTAAQQSGPSDDGGYPRTTVHGKAHFLKCVEMRKAKEKSVPVESLRSWLSYDENTGELTWTELSGRRKLGRAGAVNHKGYRQLIIAGHSFFEHRVVWAYVHGEWPVDLIDHINGIRDDNRIQNLRQVTQSENTHNKKVIPSKTGYPGVYKDGRLYYYRVSIKGKHHHSTSFKTPELAHAAYLETKRVVHPLFAELRSPDSPITSRGDK